MRRTRTVRRMGQRTAVIGDVGGHADTLVEALTDLGWEEASASLPAGLTIVQVGDLVHRGPDSHQVVQTVDRTMRRNPGRWIQLMGNHEAQYVIEKSFLWEEELDTETIAILTSWWSDGALQLAHHVPGGEQGLLVTHAGLTAGCWRHLEKPKNARQAAEVINQAGRTGEPSVFEPGLMLTGRRNTSAGVLWAEDGEELLMGWIATGEAVPFDQIHGHSNAYNWSSGRFRSNLVRSALEGRLHIDRSRRHMETLVGGRKFTGVDPGHGRQPATRWSPLVITH